MPLIFSARPLFQAQRHSIFLGQGIVKIALFTYIDHQDFWNVRILIRIPKLGGTLREQLAEQLGIVALSHVGVTLDAPYERYKA